MNLTIWIEPVVAQFCVVAFIALIVAGLFFVFAPRRVAFDRHERDEAQ